MKIFKTYILLVIIFLTGLHQKGKTQIITKDDFPPEYFTGGPVFGIPPGIDSENRLLKLGYLDVTLYGAIPGDGVDDTEEIQQAIFDSYLYSYAVYFPSGTYNVSKTLLCMTPTLINGKEERFNSTRPGHILVGASSGPRSVIKLDDNCPGFTDPSEPTYNVSNNPLRVTKRTSLRSVICFWRQAAENGGVEEYEANRGATNFNQAIRNLDIDLGSGNSGAVGIWMQGAEGTQAQDLRIYAHGAFAGLYDLPGSGGSVTNVEVYGGKYGVYSFISRPVPVITGLKLYDQTTASFHVGNFTPITFVGFEFRKASGTFLTFRNQGHPCQGNLSFIDGSFELTNGGIGSSMINNGPGDNKERILYLKDVYVKGAGTVISHTVSGRKLFVDDHTKWNKINEYQYNRVYSNPIKLIEGEIKSQSTYHDGTLTNNSITVSNQQDPPADIRTRHYWKEGFASIDYDTANILNVLDFGAIPGDNLCDAAAFNSAIDSAQNCFPAKRVFIPRGHYRINSIVHLKSDVELFGVGRHLSILQPVKWMENTQTPVITTEDNPDATCAIAGFKIELYYSQYNIYALGWKAGMNSIVKDIWVFWESNSEAGVKDNEQAIQRIQITGNGGGKWYNQIGSQGAGSRNSGSRHVLIEGSHQPLTFYGFHIQYLNTINNPMAEIINASNVNLYAFKTETSNERTTTPEGQWNYSLRIKNSRDINLIGMSGIAETETGKALVEVINPERITIANLGTWISAVYPLDSWYYVKESFLNETAAITMKERLMGLYKSGFTRSIYTLPVISTKGITFITDSSAVSGGVIDYDGGSEITATGICWDILSAPTIESKHTNDNLVSGSFISSLTGLEPDTKYFVRAYATNDMGTTYGAELEFTTSQKIGTSIKNHQHQVKIYSHNQYLIIENMQVNQPIQVFDLRGKLIYDINSNSDRMSFKLDKGFYIVRVADIINKVFIP